MSDPLKAEHQSRPDRYRRHHEVFVWREIRRLARSGDLSAEPPAHRLAADRGVRRQRSSAGPNSSPQPTEDPAGEDPSAAGVFASMPLRNLLALSIGGLVGFFLGLLEALERLPYAPTLRLGELGFAIVMVTGFAGAVRGPARPLARIGVTVLRVGLSGAVFAFVFEGMRLLLKIGDVGGAVGAWVWAGILGLLLARLAPAAAPAGSSSTAGVGSARRRTSRPGERALRRCAPRRHGELSQPE